MADPIKVLGTEQACNATPNTFGLATLVRVVNTDANNSALITQNYANGDPKSTFTLGFAGSDYSREYVIKETTETLESNSAAVVAVSVGYY